MPYSKAPVVVQEKSKKKLKLFNFSLIPSWSKQKRVPFATHNARLETLMTKPTWKRPLQKFRCLIPMTGFVEPIYTGELAGHLVEFFPKSQEIILAAGLCDQWIDKVSGEVIESFAIITREPPQFIKSVGHDRYPVFIKPEAANQWLDWDSPEAPQLIEFLKANVNPLAFEVRKHRAMKSGWQKKIPRK